MYILHPTAAATRVGIGRGAEVQCGAVQREKQRQVGAEAGAELPVQQHEAK